MPATEPVRRQRQAGSDTPVQARSPPRATAPPRGRCSGLFSVCGTGCGRARRRWDQRRRDWMPTRRCCLLSTRSAANRLRCPATCHLTEAPADLVPHDGSTPESPWTPRAPMPCDLRFSDDSAAANASNIPVPHLLSTLRSPATMHKTAGQRPAEFWCIY